MRVALSCGIEGILRRCLSSRLLKLSRLSVTSFRMGCSARQTLRPPQRALAGIPKRSLVICTPPEARGSILRNCNHLWRLRPPHRETRANKGSICRYNMLDFLLKVSPLRARERGPQPSAWKVNYPKYAELGVGGPLLVLAPSARSGPRRFPPLGSPPGRSQVPPRTLP